MYIDELHPLTAIDVSSLTAAAPAFYSATSNLLSSADPRLEVELLNDVSHVALDVTTFLSPRTAWLRLFGVIGRVLIVASDCIQDDTITLDEWAFQAVMLAVSIHLFARSAAPLVSAVFSVTALSVRDYRAYALLFQAVGLSVLQFKSLLVSSTLGDDVRPRRRRVRRRWWRRRRGGRIVRPGSARAPPREQQDHRRRPIRQGARGVGVQDGHRRERQERQEARRKFRRDRSDEPVRRRPGRGVRAADIDAQAPGVDEERQRTVHVDTETRADMHAGEAKQHASGRRVGHTVRQFVLDEHAERHQSDPC